MAKVTKAGAGHGDQGHGWHDDDHDGGHGDGGHDDHGGGGHCPPPWILTFADMAVLLMAFFVIMLMSAKTDVPKFNAFASVMRETFGRAPLDPNDADKGGTSVIDLHFGPQSGKQTNEPPSSTPQSGNPDGGGAVDAAAEALGRAMRDAAATGEITVESDAGSVTVRLPAGAGKEDAAKIAAALAAGVAAAQGASGPAAAGAGEAVGAAGGRAAADGEGVGLVRSKMAALKLGMALEDRIDDGAVQVEQRDGAVIVTIGAGGAFSSGSADMTAEAQAIIARLQEVSGKAKRIVVTGHTDNVPLSGSTYRDNWDLAAARAASVVRAITESGVVPDAELVAVSKGEEAPIADNATDEGRRKNRRIEIEIEFDEE